MKKLLIPSLIFLLGLIIGAGAVFYLVQSSTIIIPSKEYAQAAYGVAYEAAFSGTLLNDQKYSLLQDHLEENMYATLNAMQGLHLDKNNYQQAQQVVRGYFDASKRPVPEKISPFIESVPSGKGTDIRRYVQFEMTGK